jgi:hypothetical protein
VCIEDLVQRNAGNEIPNIPSQLFLNGTALGIHLPNVVEK